MTDDVFDQVRKKDHTVLTCIRNGQNDTRKIREFTTLSNRDVNYALDKLEELGLIETKTPEGRVTEVVDGQKRNFKAPRQARLTDTGLKYLASAGREQSRYEGMTHDELVEKVQDLDDQIEDLENGFETFRQQVLQRLE